MLGLVMATWISYLVLGHTNKLPLLIAPMGASAVLIFSLPSSPLTQPWCVLVGNSIAAAVGVTFTICFGPYPLVAATAVAVAILTMFATRSLHPPGGAIALLAVLGGPSITDLGWRYVLTPVALQSTCLIFVAVLFHRLNQSSYPHVASPQANLHRTGDLQISARLGVSDADLDAVLRQHGELLDISRGDLQNLIAQTEIQLHRRHHGEVVCRDIMSTHLITVTFETPLGECWQLLRTHKIKTLPVVDDKNRVIGIISLIDFLKNAGLDVYHDFDLRLRQLLDNTRQVSGSHFQVAGHIMNTAILSKHEDSNVLELVELFTDRGLHSIPIVNRDAQLQGMITQSDLIAALYRLQIEKVL